jgi:hypothetical protein
MREHEQAGLPERERDDRERRRIEVVEHVARVAEADEPEQHEVRARADRGDRRGGAPREPAVGDPEAQLLGEEPHEGHVEQGERLEPGGEPQDVAGQRPDGECGERPPRRAGVERRESGQVRLRERVRREEPDRRRDAEADEPDRDGVDAREVHGQDPDREGGEQCDRWPGQPQDAGPDVVGGRSARGLEPSPGADPREPADHEEQRHDLRDPRQRPDPGRLEQGALDDEPAAGHDRGADHQEVAGDDEHHAEHPHEVHRGVAGRPIARGSVGMRHARLGHGPSDVGWPTASLARSRARGARGRRASRWRMPRAGGPAQRHPSTHR